MIVVKVTIKGTSPILLNNPASMGSNTTGKKVIPTPQQEAESKCYWDTGHSSLVIPSWNLFRCLVSASKGFRDGRKSLSPTFNAGVRIEPEDYLSFGTDKYEIDIRRAVVQRQGVLRARPKLTSWALNFDLLVDTEDFPQRLLPAVEKIVEDAGRRIGLGDFRLEKSGPYGKFVVESWEVQ